MTSAIDTTVPVTGSPTTQSVRDNFGIAASEISGAQSDIANLQDNFSAVASQLAVINQRLAVLEARYMPAVHSEPTDPQGTSSTSYVMMGLAPSFSAPLMPPGDHNTRLVVTMSGQLGNTGNGFSTDVILVWGTGPAPSWGDALTGTQAGTPMTVLTGRANQTVPFSETVIIAGLAPGTNYWIDLAAKVNNGQSILSALEIVVFGLIDQIS